MNITSVEPGAIVRVDRKGRIFDAEVTGREDRALRVTPLRAGITYTTATSREVIAHWARREPDEHGKVRTASIKPGDIVAYADTLAHVLRKDGQWLIVEPVALRDERDRITSRRLTGHYARRGRPRGTE